MNPISNVPVIPPNLRREETIVQIANVLNYLEDISNDILDRINRRISSNESHLSAISSRITVVHNKIDKLSGIKKATQVFSSSKYPATEVNRQYVSLFKDGKPPSMRSFNVDFKTKKPDTKNEPMDTLLFYHVKVKDDQNKLILNGLGEAPKEITSVNDLLLFNSSTNPYNKYVISDTLHEIKSSRKEEVMDTSELGAAPASISDRAAFVKSVRQTFSYTPNLGDVPAIEVPIHLPDLPGIADDLRYVNELGPGIAPSVITTPVAPEVPALDIEIIEKVIVTKEPVTSSPKELPVETKVEIPPKIEVPIQAEIPKEEVEIETLTPQENKVEVRRRTEDKKTPEVQQAPDNARASLMDAIRKAGGKSKLKRTDSTGSQKKPSAVTGDLMTDLYAKLAMRRKGISGSKPHSQIDTGSAMHKVSAMIPPPPTDTDSADNPVTDDQDWED